MQKTTGRSGCYILWMTLVSFIIVSCSSTKNLSHEPNEIDSTRIEQQPATPQTEVVEVDRIDPGPYRAEYTKYHDLMHTRLELRFNWELQHLLGTALLELRPYFYPQDVLVLDAKGFDIHSVQLVNGNDKRPLSYGYDDRKLTISLDRTYHRTESYFVEIKYTAKPNDLEEGGSVAITSDKGLYFINPLGSEKDKPQQIWTQGEPESSSCWFPTIDSPNQRTTQEMYITVEERFTTLSNGQLVYSRSNNDGTRTDYWKMDRAHAPYLFMMAIGEFAVVKDQWQDKEVWYYVEPEYEPYAKSIFGKTPEMMTFFSDLLKYPYPWSKYSQVVVRDYVSGAMENTTASVFMEDLQVDSRFLIDDDWDGIIAHELFHHWFGDLVTSESWSNLTLNEAFATYSEYLWAEHLLGKDDADFLGYQEIQNYLEEAEDKKVDLIRFYYQDKEYMFDSHSYAKGSRILHMLREYLGDDAFFTVLNNYLTTYADQPVEVHHLRLAAEKISGQDLNWFFNQWFLDSGHPELQVETIYEHDTLTLSITQIQDLDHAPVYRLPMEIELWQSQQRDSKKIVLDQQHQVFEFQMDSEPDLVLVDPNNQLLAEIQHPLSIEELIHQYRVSSRGLTRYKALNRLLEDSVDSKVISVFLDALKDPFWPVRQLSVNAFMGYPEELAEELIPLLEEIATNDEKSLVRADAITTLSSFSNDEVFTHIYREAMYDSSYAVAGAGLTAYLQLDQPDRNEIARQFEREDNIQLVIPLADYYALKNIPDKYPWFQQKLEQSNGELMYYLVNYFGQYLVKANSEVQLSGARYLEDLALNHSTYYIRYAAFQALYLLDGVEGVAEMKQRIKDSETDPRLVEVYTRFP